MNTDTALVVSDIESISVGPINAFTTQERFHSTIYSGVRMYDDLKVYETKKLLRYVNIDTHFPTHYCTKCLK